MNLHSLLTRRMSWSGHDCLRLRLRFRHRCCLWHRLWNFLLRGDFMTGRPEEAPIDGAIRWLRNMAKIQSLSDKIAYFNSLADAVEAQGRVIEEQRLELER